MDGGAWVHPRLAHAARRSRLASAVKTLGIDTSSSLVSVALFEGDVQIACSDEHAPRAHGERVLPLVERTLAEAHVASSELNLLAVGLGPGTFTGTRIGVATAKALAVGLDLPIVGVDSLRARALAVAEVRVELLAPLANAYKGEVFAGVYRVLGRTVAETIVPPFHAPLAEAHEKIARVVEEKPRYLPAPGVAGAVVAGAVVAGAESGDVPVAGAICVLARAHYGLNGSDNVHALEPLYVRRSDAKLPKRPLSLR